MNSNSYTTNSLLWFVDRHISTLIESHNDYHNSKINDKAMMRITATTDPPMMAAVLSVVGSEVDGCVGWHSTSPRDEIATEHSESTVTSTPLMMMPASPLTHSSIREMSEPLSVSELSSSLARYVTDVGDSEKQTKDGISMNVLVTPHSVQEKLLSVSVYYTYFQ